MSRKQNHWDAVHGIEFKKNALQNTNLKADQIAAIESKIRDLESRLRTVKRSAK